MKRCSVANCHKPARKRGLCHAHYDRWLHTGSVREKEPLRIFTPPDGRTNHPAYGAWNKARNRCHNKNNLDYPRYGGRGIEMLSEWREDFWAFAAYVDSNLGEKGELTLDRIDNERGYIPGNIRWASMAEQSRNRRSTKLSQKDINEIKKSRAAGRTFKSIADQYGVSATHISHIVNGKKWLCRPIVGRERCS